MLSFSVVIVTRDRASYLTRALRALAAQRASRFELIVVDNGSTDDTATVLQRYAGRVRLSRCPEPNIARARNQALRLAAGELVAFIDDDAVAEPDWLRYLEPCFADARVAVAGGYIRDRTGIRYQSRATVCDRFGASEQFVTVDGASAAVGPCAPGVSRFLCPTGTNIAFRRDTLLAIGGFDEEYAYHLDETDAVVRLIDAGFEVRLAPAAQVHHAYAPSAARDAQRIPRSLYLPTRSRVYFTIRHAGELSPMSTVEQRLAWARRADENEVRWLAKRKLLSEDEVARLSHEIVRGEHDGRHDAAARPRPTRLEVAAMNFSPYDVIAMQGPVAPAIVIATPQTDATLVSMAQGLAAHGALTTLIQAGAARAAEFVDGLWVHTYPAGRAAARAVHSALMDAQLRRGVDVVIASLWNPAILALLAGIRIPLLLVVTTPDTGQQIDPSLVSRAITRCSTLIASTAAAATRVGERLGLRIDSTRIAVLPEHAPEEALVALCERARNDHRANDE